MTDPCDGECLCSKRRRLEWNSPVEEIVGAIEVHNPEGVCIERDGKCDRVPCCKDKPGETTEEGW